ncbi:hypothetical protein Fmac_023615 [Flemingia macrophylla]|uniref:Sec-independent protein translocase protein TATB, chloroplastic n=1 Tax=Flemingia macrophylla TaxID=520843 RepID=A0ABD1LM24_9FABA
MTPSLAMASSSMLCPRLGNCAVGNCAVSPSSSVTSHTKIQTFRLSSMFSLLGRGLFSPWSGLKHLGMSNRPKPLSQIDRKGGCKGKVVYASLFGVGAPEALVIGVVALLVFGPKGLAEVARNLGKTLRAFQPTIRELQDVSREFKSTLEREIGLDDNLNPTQNTYNSSTRNTTSTSSTVDPNGKPDPIKAYSSEDYLKITEEQLKASAAQQQGQTPPKEGEIELQIQPPAKETATTVPPPQKPESETSPLDS